MDIPLQDIAGPYVAEGATPQLTQVAWTAVDQTETHTFPIASSAGTLLMVRGEAIATIAGTITIHSSANKFGREADITAFGATDGETYLRIFKRHGWENFPGSGLVSFEVSNANLEVAAIRL